jgi:flagellar motor component MotA
MASGDILSVLGGKQPGLGIIGRLAGVITPIYKREN